LQRLEIQVGREDVTPSAEGQQKSENDIIAGRGQAGALPKQRVQGRQELIPKEIEGGKD